MAKSRYAFTLIEHLVVIAIIAILAAILFPVFAQARESAHRSSDLSNIKQVNTSILMYVNDFDGMYPSAYFHRAFNPALGGLAGGRVHWSAKIMPYVRNLDIFVSPGCALGGHAPACFASGDNNRGRGWPAGQLADGCPVGGSTPPGTPQIGGFIVSDQAPRLSYTVNAAVMARLRNIRDVRAGIRVVSQTAFESPSNTIILAGLVDDLRCLNGECMEAGQRNSSHRTTNAATRDAANQVQFLGDFSDAAASQIFALNFQQVRPLFDECRNNPRITLPFITYHSWNRWNEGDNYGMVDGSARHMRFSRTIQPDSYQWGAVMVTLHGQRLIDPISGRPVQN